MELLSEVTIGEISRRHGIAQQVLRVAGIDFTGERLLPDGSVVSDTPIEAAIRMAEYILTAHPDGIEMLRNAGIEV